MEKFVKKNTVDHQSIRQWSARSVLETLREKERVDLVEWFPVQTGKVIWLNASSPELSNQHQDIAWLVVRRAVPVRSFMHTWTLHHCTLPLKWLRRGQDCHTPPSGMGLSKGSLESNAVDFLSWFIPNISVKRDSVLYSLLPMTHTETNITYAWRTLNAVKHALWSAQNLLVFRLKELTSTECCRLAHSKVQDCMLRDPIKLGATAAKAVGYTRDNK
eukprot:g44397.t1